MSDSEITVGDVVITSDDVVGLNRTSVERAAAFTRIAGSVLIAVGILAVGAWLWVSVRGQQEAYQLYGGLGSPEEGADLVDRMDVFTQTFFNLVFGAMVLGTGIALRLVADYTVTRVGGSVSGLEVGDRLSDDDDDADGPAGAPTPF